MIRVQRRVHQLVWLVLLVALPTLLGFALVARREHARALHTAAHAEKQP